ncbi:hypothetical protein EVAR_84030_1 [Eumeta japonica]|uniref:Uncharacterized protein n=1 Tax=Eumeta variegata TaxID=151549 RepID=A0A4C1X999_EUMVA|nr:hypothetical protein EVAR_84030_1 [Eumeta japonica]
MPILTDVGRPSVKTVRPRAPPVGRRYSHTAGSRGPSTRPTSAQTRGKRTGSPSETRCLHLQRSHQCITGLWEGMGFVVEGDRDDGGGRSVGHRNSHSLDDNKQWKLLLPYSLTAWYFTSRPQHSSSTHKFKAESNNNEPQGMSRRRGGQVLYFWALFSPPRKMDAIVHKSTDKLRERFGIALATCKVASDMPASPDEVRPARVGGGARRQTAHSRAARLASTLLGMFEDFAFVSEKQYVTQDISFG